MLLEYSVLQTGAPCAMGRCHYVTVPYSCPPSSATLEDRISVSQHPHAILELYVDVVRQGFESKRLEWPGWVSPRVAQGRGSSDRRKAKGERKTCLPVKTAFATVLSTTHHKPFI